jgi:hypothetical protein
MNMSFISSLFGSRKTEEMTYRKNRRKQRHGCDISTELMDSAGRLWSCRIVDMSETGFGIKTTAPLSAGNCLNIIRPSIQAEVVWSRGDRSGLKPTP